MEKINDPIDLVGHDWGAGHVAGVALTRPDLLNSWCIDLAGLFHKDYEWHDMAQAWQTESVGEQVVAAMITPPLEDKINNLKGLVDGMTNSIATQMAKAQNEEMGRCILNLYRDTAQPVMRNLGNDVSVMRQTKGHVIIAEQDHYVGTEAMARHTAERAGASVSYLEAVGHWWMIQNPQLGADTLNNFWRSL